MTLLILVHGHIDPIGSNEKIPCLAGGMREGAFVPRHRRGDLDSGRTHGLLQTEF
jgi:hypothetical protein